MSDRKSLEKQITPPDLVGPWVRTLWDQGIGEALCVGSRQTGNGLLVRVRTWAQGQTDHLEFSTVTGREWRPPKTRPRMRFSESDRQIAKRWACSVGVTHTNYKGIPYLKR